jgi:monoamine oxidase
MISQDDAAMMLRHAQATGLLPNGVSLNGTSVAIVGGGIAGAFAAHLASTVGANVTIIEIAPTIGGRTMTHRWADGGWFELGGMRLKVDNERLFVSLIRECGLELVPFENPNAEPFLHFNSQTFVTSNISASAGSCRLMGLPGVRDKCCDKPTKIVGRILRPFLELEKAGFQAAVLAVLGATTERALALRSGLSDDERLFMEIGGNTAGYASFIGGAEFYTDSGHFAADNTADASGAPPERFMTVRGGFQQVSKLLVARAQEKHGDRLAVKLGRRVTRVVQQADGRVSVCYRPVDNADAEQCDVHDAAIVSVPVPVLNKIEFVPELPRAKRYAAQLTPYDNAIKVALRFDVSKPVPWDAQRFPWGTAVSTDLPSRMIYIQNHTVFIYVWGGDTARLVGHTHEERVERLVADWAAITGTSRGVIKAAMVESISKSWASDPRFGGAFALLHTGDLESLHRGLIGGDYEDCGEHAYGARSVVRFTGEHKNPLGHAWVETSLISVLQEFAYLAACTFASDKPASGQCGAAVAQWFETAHRKEKAANDVVRTCDGRACDSAPAATNQN